MKSISLIAKIIVLLVILGGGLHLFKTKFAEKDAFEKYEALIAETNECLNAAEWKCAERNVLQLLQENPNDENLQLHMAGILFEQERYEDCIRFIDSLHQEKEDFKFLKKKSESLLHEMRTLDLERSAHFRLEFEGRPSRNEVLEALSVLEVAYDSLCRLFSLIIQHLYSCFVGNTFSIFFTNIYR